MWVIGTISVKYKYEKACRPPVSPSKADMSIATSILVQKIKAIVSKAWAAVINNNMFRMPAIFTYKGEEICEMKFPMT